MEGEISAIFTEKSDTTFRWVLIFFSFNTHQKYFLDYVTSFEKNREKNVFFGRKIKQNLTTIYFKESP